MILRIRIKNDRKFKKNKITAWIQREEKFEKDLKQLFKFFENEIEISKIRRIYKYYRITSDNPAIMMSFFSTVYDLIPEIYFNLNETMEKGNSILL